MCTIFPVSDKNNFLSVAGFFFLPSVWEPDTLTLWAFHVWKLKQMLAGVQKTQFCCHHGQHPPFLFPLALLHIYMCCCYVSLLNTRNWRGIRPCKCHSPFIALPLRNPGTLCTCALLGLIWFFWWEWEVTEMLQLQRKNAVSSPSQVFCTLHFLKSPEWKDRKS